MGKNNTMVSLVRERALPEGARVGHARRAKFRIGRTTVRPTTSAGKFCFRGRGKTPWPVIRRSVRRDFEATFGWPLPPDQPLGRDRQEAARFAGWLRELTSFRTMRKLVKAGTEDRGIQSPAHAWNLWEVSQRFPSPHRFMRWATGVLRRGDKILEPFGLRTAFKAVCMVAQQGDRRVGRAAVTAAALTAARWWAGQCQEAARLVPGDERIEAAAVRLATEGDHALVDECRRRPRQTLVALCGLRGFVALAKRRQRVAAVRVFEGLTLKDAAAYAAALTLDDTNGVEALIEEKRRETAEYVGQKAWAWSEEFWLVRRKADDATFHAPVGASFDAALKAARAAFLRRDIHRADVLAVQRRLDAVVDRTLLVRYRDSEEAGNCLLGSKEWARAHGVGRRQVVPATVLVPHLGDERVRRVVERVLLREGL